MLEYYKGKKCISRNDLIGHGIMTEANYKQMSWRGDFTVARTGGGKGNYALVVVDTLPDKYRDQVALIFPDSEAVMVAGWVRENYQRDQAAVVFFNDRTQTGLDLKPEKKEELIVNASVLNTCIRLYERAKTVQRLMGYDYHWEKMADAIKSLQQQYGHTLPTSPHRFRKKVAEYRKNGYASLLSGKFGNQCARRMSSLEERVVVSIACLENQPYNTTVREMYEMFVYGELEVWDYETGEVLDPSRFARKGEAPWIPSEATIANYLNKQKNKIIIESRHRSRMTFLHEQMPHMHRHNGNFSLSQITMDDVDLSRKLKDTKQRVHAYYAYDVVSQCVLGAAYGRKKDQGLVVDCFRDMFRLIAGQGWGIPAGIEVENHLMSEYREGFLKAGEVFRSVHFCAAQNSQEKYAEPLNGAKKRSVIHKNHANIGRFYGKGKWRTEGKKVSDEFNDTYEDQEYFSWEQLVAEDRADNQEWNNALHPDQKRFPGMTRWQVLVANINPTLRPFDKLTLSKYIGERVETSIRRNSTVRVAYTDWWLSSPAVLERLEPNNLKVTAYYIPGEDGTATEVYIFQGENYIDTLQYIPTYNRVYAEQTEEEDAAFAAQQKKVAEFRKYVADNAPIRVGTAKRSTKPTIAAEAAEIAPVPIEEIESPLAFSNIDYSKAGENAL
ncbi:hypothetical protein [uncultured Duncaniella sp.]|uniref:hypothetical protein n=1 Tax=uncultured Duncaniella sp. TaxID=2768039 RepID=UPI0026127C0F|nr:hypothetical protein [uncultured Duncaniella sp.]